MRAILLKAAVAVPLMAAALASAQEPAQTAPPQHDTASQARCPL